MGRILGLALLILGLTGSATAHDEIALPSAAVDAITDLQVELPQVTGAVAAVTLEPPYGLVALSVDGRLRLSFTEAVEGGCEEEAIEERPWTERPLALYRWLLATARHQSHRLGLVRWTRESEMPFLVVADRRVPWLRVSRVIQALQQGGIRRFHLAAFPIRSRAPRLLAYELLPRSKPYGGAGFPRVGAFARVAVAEGKEEGEILRRVYLSSFPPDDGDHHPPIDLDDGPLTAAFELEEQLRPILAAGRTSAGREGAWLRSTLDTAPIISPEVTWGQMLPIAAVLLRADLDDVRLGVRTLTSPLPPNRDPFPSFAAYEADRAKHLARPRIVQESDWLEAHQADDGSWPHLSADGVHQDVAVTALALLPSVFVGVAGPEPCGWRPPSVSRALAWLESVQDEKGRFRSPHDVPAEQRALDHAAATLAVVSAWILRPDPDRAGPVRAALDALPPPPPPHAEVTTADLLALLARLKAGTEMGAAQKAERKPLLYVPYEAFDPRVPDPLPDGWTEQASVRALTYEALVRVTMPVEQVSNRSLARIAAALSRHAPRWTEDGATIDVFAWWFGVEALSRFGATPWKVWHEALRPILIPGHRREDGAVEDVQGSWDPPAAGPHRGGRVTMTAVMALIEDRFFPH